MKDIKIVEYEHKYAAATAEMWKNSGNGWNGETFLTTEQDVITDEENSIKLNSWLALDGDMVVGYCNLYEYQEDTGALYIGLLGVRDDYHGEKFGKALVLKAVERTIELGWDRLDLYTWSGNTKAVPLYKKTGFFWEDRDDSTHLINLIPSVLKNEMIKDYFDEIDWYNDSIRKIEVKPDGRKENEFEYLTYEWEKDGKHLLAEFCRRGRGLRKIETDDYSITVTVEDLKLVFGNSYKIKYDIINKTAKPLNMKIKGIDEKNIIFNFDKIVVVDDDLSFEAEFLVNKIEKEQSVWKTHPNVISEIEIDGKKAEFKVGIEPRFPAKIELSKEKGICFTDIETDLYIDIENNFDEDAVFSFVLPENDSIKFVPNCFSVEMKAKEKRSIPTKYILKKGCVYSPEIIVNTKREKQGTLKFKIRTNNVFHSLNDIFYGETQTRYIIGNGSYHLSLSYKEFMNNFRIGDMKTDKCWIGFRYPKVGKPFTDEFNKKSCEKVECSIEGTAIVMKVYFSSDKFAGISFVINHKLYASGIIERWFEFENNGYNSKEKVFFKDSLGIGLSQMVLSYNNEIIETSNDVTGGTGNWRAEKLSENWIYKIEKHSSVGICWADDVKIKFGDWEKFFEYDLSELEVGERKVFKPITIAMNVFVDPHKFREFALKQHLKRTQKAKDLEFKVNDGNPFIYKNLNLAVIEKKKKTKEGKIVIDLQNEKIFLGEFSKDNTKLEKEFSFIRKEEIEILTMHSQLDDVKRSCRKAIFPIRQNQIIKEEINIDGLQVLKISNGIISMQTSPDFAPSLHSLKYKGKEWLDSSFPKPCSKGWWKPWFGGIRTIPERLRMKTILEEEFTTEFVKKTDDFGNDWEGFCISISIEKNEKYKGLKLKQYFLLLSGVPVMMHAVEVIQNTGRFFVNEPIETGNFFKPDQDLQNCSFISKNRDGKIIEAKAGRKTYDFEGKSPLIIKGENNEELLQIYLPSEKTWSWLCEDIQLLNAWIGDNISCEDKTTMFINPRFYIFGKEKLEQDMLIDLGNVRFE
jgi:ribosomal protein S18 acetylase RimI-like enzyme